MINKTVLMTAFILSLLLVFILSGNASRPYYTLVVPPPDENGGFVEVNTTIPFIPSNSTEIIDVVAEIGLNFSLNTGENGTTGAVFVNMNASRKASQLNAVEAGTGTYGIAMDQKSLDRYIEVKITGDIANISSYNMEMHYTDADLDQNDNGIIGDPGDINSQSLRIYRYHNDISKWMPLVPGHPYYMDGGSNTSNRYLWVEVNHLSTFTLVGTVIPRSSASSGSSGDGSGSGGVVTSETSTNIEKAESFDRSLIANTPVTYTYKIPELGIYEIAVTGKENENNIALRVEVLKGTSKLVTISAPGIVYKNVNIQAGSKQIKEFLIKFKVENSWITGNNLAGSDVRMVKWDGGKWMQIETSEKSKDNTYTFYEVKTDALFVFAITGLKNEVAPKATQAIEITKTPSRPTGQATSGIPIKTENVRGFEIILAIATILAVYRAFRKKR